MNLDRSGGEWPADPSGKPPGVGQLVLRVLQQLLTYLLAGVVTLVAVLLLLFLLLLALSGPAKVTVFNRTGAPLRDVTISVFEGSANPYAEKRVPLLAPGDSLLFVVKNGREYSTLRFSAFDPSGRAVRDSTGIYLDDFTEDHFEVVNGTMDVESHLPGTPRQEIPGAVRLEMGHGDTVFHVSISLLDTARVALLPEIRIPRLDPGDTVQVTPRRYRGFATLIVSGTMNGGREFRDSSDVRFGPGGFTRRAALRGPRWRRL